MTLNSYVVSASVTNATVSNLEIPVLVTLRHLQTKEVCVDTINQPPPNQTTNQQFNTIIG